MKNKLPPLEPEKYANRLERLRKHFGENSIMTRVPPLIMSECLLLVQAYHGGPWPTIRYLVWMEFFLAKARLRGMIVFWICDRAGWSKKYHVPETATHMAHWQRHGRKCSGSPNCRNINCVDDSIPTWFKNLVSWDDHY